MLSEGPWLKWCAAKGPLAACSCLVSLMGQDPRRQSCIPGCAPHPTHCSLPPHRCSPCRWPMGKAGPLPWLVPSLEAQVGPCHLGAVSLHKKMRVCRRRAGAEQERGTAPDLKGRVGLRLDAGLWTGCWGQVQQLEWGLGTTSLRTSCCIECHRGSLEVSIASILHLDPGLLA